MFVLFFINCKWKKNIFKILVELSKNFFSVFYLVSSLFQQNDTYKEEGEIVGDLSDSDAYSQRSSSTGFSLFFLYFYL